MQGRIIHVSASQTPRSVVRFNNMFKKSKPIFPNTVSELNTTLQNLLNSNAEQLEELGRALSPEEEHFLDYFWNGRKQKLRRTIPQSVLYFFEADQLHDSMSEIVRSRVNVITLGLEIKKYLVRSQGQDGTCYSLTVDGVEHLKDKHPTVLMYWERFLHLLPPTLTLVAAIVGFIASVFGIIQFLEWLSKR
jgi:hypothetical protein